MRLSSRSRPVLIAIVILLVGLVISPLALALHIYQYGQADRAAPSDVIIILGAGTRPSGAPSVAHTRRLQHGAALYRKGLAPYVLCTGGVTANHPTSEARACADYLKELGIPETAILLEEISRSTEENAIEARKVMAERGFQAALLVSDNYHLWRAEHLFQAQGLRVTLSPAQVTVGPLNWRIAVSNTLREVAATGWYLLKSLLGLPITNA